MHLLFVRLHLPYFWINITSAVIISTSVQLKNMLLFVIFCAAGIERKHRKQRLYHFGASE
jgi:hypothetical protein